MSSPSRPSLPPTATPRPGAASSDALRRLRRFHLGLSKDTGAPVGELFPASLRALSETRNETDAAPEPAAPLARFVEEARKVLAPARATCRHETLELAACGRALLGDGDDESGARPDVTEGLGGLGSRFLDPSSLTEMLGTSGASVGGSDLPPERLKQALDDLGPLVDEARPELIVIHSDDPALPEGLADGPDGVEIVEHEDPPTAAAEYFDRHAESLARALRAVRLLRLVTAGEYRAGVHDPWLEQLDWQGFTRDELHLLPQVVSVVGAEAAAGPCMASLSRLLLSGRPVQIFVVRPPLSDSDDASFRFEPATFGLGHREALVQQTSPARPEHMVEGFDRSLAATRAALHVISGVSTAREAPVDAYLEGRAHPLFHYDPEAGSGWAERFDLSANPQPEEDWPVYEMTVDRPAGGEETLKLPVTFADVALLEPTYARHFAPVPENVADHHLLTVAAYCTRPPAEEVTEIPYLWAFDQDSRLCRVAISRTLALACRDRLGTWRALQEFGGIGSGYVRQAVEGARQAAEQRAAEELARVKTEADAELERIRHDAARDVVDRLTSALLDVDLTSLAGPESAGVAYIAATPGVAGSALQGASVDQVSAALLGLLDGSDFDGGVAPDTDDDGQVGRVTSELLRLIDEQR